VCFSAQVDAVSGVVVTFIGLDAFVHVHRGRHHVALAALPLLLGAHQLAEAFV
jgi:hypothetical protein